MSDQTRTKYGTCGHHATPLEWVDDDKGWRCRSCFPEFFWPRPDPALQATVVSLAQLLRVQKGLLDLSNYTTGVRGGWVDTADAGKWQDVADQFLVVDALLRDLIKEAESREEDEPCG